MRGEYSELGAFQNALREFLGLAPLSIDGVKNKNAEKDIERFYIQPWANPQPRANHSNY